MDVKGQILELDDQLLDIRISAKEGYDVATGYNLFTIIDTNLSDELLNEGYAREFISKVQQMRKNNGYEMMDRIKIFYTSSPEIDKAVKDFQDYIKEETLADAIIVSNEEGMEVQNLNGIDKMCIRDSNNIYDTLVGVTPDWQIVPRLAEKWVLSDDGMEITFALRDDVYFHNGRQMTAKDVEYSFNRLKDAESPRARDYINIVKIEVLSDYEIKFTTETLDVELLKSFVYPWAAVVPEEDVANLKTKPVGTAVSYTQDVYKRQGSGRPCWWLLCCFF